MNKAKIQILGLIFGLAITATSLVYGQTDTNDESKLEKDHNLHEPTSTVALPYLAYVQIQIRDAGSALVGTIDTDVILYRTTHVTDELLNSYPVLAIVKKDGIKYEKREITAKIISKEDTALPRTDLFSSKRDGIIVFSALHHAFVLDQGYTYTIKWTIYKPIFE